jgi:hypothetical protein
MGNPGGCAETDMNRLSQVGTKTKKGNGRLNRQLRLPNCQGKPLKPLAESMKELENIINKLAKSIHSGFIL